MTGISSSEFRGIAPLTFLTVLLAGCPSVTLTLGPELSAAARLERACALKAAAWLIGPGQMRVNIEPEAEAEGSCGVSLYIKAADPEHATIEVRCPAGTGKGLPKDGGAMGSLFEKTGSSVVSWACNFAPENIDFSPGEETENAGCFVAETAEKKLLTGCFSTTGLYPVQTPNRLKPITK
ncbi:MAG: hypothetical protein HY897_14080 [Deltaproteobacteria bacterium]|nr:hypothetical protein [Deltaproteobacteria bacterium]